MRLALIGCGRHMQGVLAPFLMRMREPHYAYCVDPDLKAAQAVQALTGATTCLPSVYEVNLQSIDAAIVAVPPRVAFDVTKHLIANGIPCLVEKPPSPSTEMTLELLQAAKKRDVYVQVGFNFRHATAPRTVWEQARLYGRPLSLHIDFRSRHPSLPEWGVENVIEAWLRHNGVHCLDLMSWLMEAETTSVVARLLQQSDGQFLVWVVCTHSNSSVSVLSMGNMTDSFELRAEILTSDLSTLVMPNLGEVRLLMEQGKPSGRLVYRTKNLDDGWSRSGYGPELKYFMDNARSSEQGSVYLEAALTTSKLCDAILEAIGELPGGMIAASHEKLQGPCGSGPECYTQRT